jgi:hypothetical protein
MSEDEIKHMATNKDKNSPQTLPQPLPTSL